jgi:hypothetical protein
MSASHPAAPHLPDYDRYLDSRWRGRLRALGLLSMAQSVLVLLSDRFIGSLLGAAPSWGQLARVRLPWILITLLAMGMYRVPARLRTAVILPLCAAYYGGTSWGFFQLGRGLGVRHLVVLFIIARACLSYIPLRRSGM